MNKLSFATLLPASNLKVATFARLSVRELIRLVKLPSYPNKIDLASGSWIAVTRPLLSVTFTVRLVGPLAGAVTLTSRVAQSVGELYVKVYTPAPFGGSVIVL